VRKATLASILRQTRAGVRLNEHLEHTKGAVVFQHACKMGLELFRSGWDRVIDLGVHQTGSSSKTRTRLR
jgi:hypothetical protein